MWRQPARYVPRTMRWPPVLQKEGKVRHNGQKKLTWVSPVNQCGVRNAWGTLCDHLSKDLISFLWLATLKFDSYRHRSVCKILHNVFVWKVLNTYLNKQAAYNSTNVNLTSVMPFFRVKHARGRKEGKYQSLCNQDMWCTGEKGALSWETLLAQFSSTYSGLGPKQKLTQEGDFQENAVQTIHHTFGPGYTFSVCKPFIPYSVMKSRKRNLRIKGHGYDIPSWLCRGWHNSCFGL